MVSVVTAGQLEPTAQADAGLGERDGGGWERRLRAAWFPDARFLWRMASPALDAIGDGAPQVGQGSCGGVGKVSRYSRHIFIMRRTSPAAHGQTGRG